MSSKRSLIDAIETTTFGMLDLSNSSMFAVFAKDKWLKAFNSSWLRFLLLPAVAIGFFINAIIGIIRFSGASNKNLTKALGLSAQILGAIGASISIFGSMISDVVFHSAFAIGPYFFLGAVAIGLTFNVSQVFARIHDLRFTPAHSFEQVTYKRALVGHLFVSFMLSSIVASVVSVMLVPGFPLVAAVSSLSASAFCLLSFSWNFLLPKALKSNIQNALGLAYPQKDMALAPKDDLSSVNKEQLHNKQRQAEKDCRLTFFRRAYRKESVHLLLQESKFAEAKRYLITEVDKKLNALNLQLINYPNSQKHLDKISLITTIQGHLNSDEALIEESLEKLYQDTPLARQSFFASDVGDVEDLVQAYMLYEREKAQQDISQDNSLTAALR